MMLIATNTATRHSGMFAAGIYLADDSNLLFYTHHKYGFRLQTCRNDNIEKIKAGTTP